MYPHQLAVYIEILHLYSPHRTMAFLIIFLLCLPILLSFLLSKHKTSKGVCWPPGPRGLPLIGNLHQFDNSNAHRYLWNLSKQYGDVMFLRLGFVPTLVVSSAKVAKEIMRTHDLQFCSRPAIHAQQKLSYSGSDLAFAPYNDYWREMRKVCVIHLFNSAKVQQFRPIREDEVSRMMENISKAAAASKPVNISEMMMSLTSTITCRFAFGERQEDEGTEKSRFHSLLTETQDLFGSFFFTDHFPFMSWVDNLTGMISRLEKTFKKLDAICQKVMDDHLDPKRSQTDQQEDIIDVLLQLKKQREFKIDLTWDHIKGVLLDIIVGGTDTGAVTLVWAMTYLMKNPRVMEKAQEEVRHVLKNKGFVDEDAVQRLQYLKAVVKETMRLQPALPLLVPRETTEKCILDGYEIPPKTTVYVNAWAIGRDPEVWDNPDEFNPDKFIGSCIDLKGQNFELIPFGAGRRICPGMSMGLATVELTLANLLCKFDWEMPDGMKKEDLDFDVRPGVVIHKKNALRLVARNVP